MDNKNLYKIWIFKKEWLSFLVKDAVFYDDGSGIIEGTDGGGKRLVFKDWVFIEVMPDA